MQEAERVDGGGRGSMIVADRLAFSRIGEKRNSEWAKLGYGWP